MRPLARPLLLAASRRQLLAARSLHASPRRMSEAAPLPTKKPMGAFRGGLFGFLLGCVLSGGTVYSYILTEYKASNDLLAEDIYTMQATVGRLSSYVKTLEDKMQKK